jgi:hypothetical protein
MTTLLDLKRAAEVVGVRYRTMRNYHQIAERHRRLAAEKNDPSYIRPGDLPPPDDVYGRSPVWKLSTIERFVRQRPGRGAGGGRPAGSAKRGVDKEGVSSEGGSDHGGASS